MNTVAGHLVVHLKAPCGLQLAVCWDGGEWAHVGTFTPAGESVQVQRWRMADAATGAVFEPCTPATFRQVVELHLEDPAAAAQLAADARAAVDARTVSRTRSQWQVQPSLN